MKREQPQSAFSQRVRRRHARAFTLVELVVGIGVMLLLITMAGTVFSYTLRSTGQAKALTDVTARLRAFERELAADLAAIPRHRSRLVIRGRAINAYWTEAQREIDTDGDPGTGAEPKAEPDRFAWSSDEGLSFRAPRADLLLLFTARPGSSRLAPGVHTNAQMVVYGHGELGELDGQTGNWRVSPRPFDNSYIDPRAQYAGEVFPLPAEQWQLARQAVMVVNRWWSVGEPTLQYCAADPTDTSLFTGQKDILGNDGSGTFDYARDVVGGAGASVAEWALRTKLDATPPASVAGRVELPTVPNCASFKVEWALPLDGIPDPDGVLADLPTIWVDPYRSPEALQNGTPPDWERLLGQYELRLANHTSDLQGVYGANGAATRALTEMKDYVTGTGPNYRFKRTANDPLVMTHEFLPRDPQGAVQGSPEDPDPFFPKALRITVDVYDDTDRLERPIRQVMVLPVGN